MAWQHFDRVLGDKSKHTGAGQFVDRCSGISEWLRDTTGASHLQNSGPHSLFHDPTHMKQFRIANGDCPVTWRGPLSLPQVTAGSATQKGLAVLSLEKGLIQHGRHNLRCCLILSPGP